MWKRDWWIGVTIVLLALEAACFLVPQARPGVLGLVFWFFGQGLPDLAWPLLVIALIWCTLRRPFWNRRRVVGFVLIVTLGLARFAFRVYPSSHDFSPSLVRFRLPWDGPVTVGWGGGSPRQNYHVVAPDQRWAYDLLVMKDGRTFRGDGKTVDDYYCYGLPILAPASGVVQAVFTEDTDRPIGEMEGYKNSAGNYVVLNVAPDQYLWLCHLKPGSIRVKPGDRVVEGQELARVGNSGHTSEPHLHIHLQDSTEEDFAEGIPLYFHHYRTGGRYVERGIPTGGFQGDQFAGQEVENVSEPPVPLASDAPGR